MRTAADLGIGGGAVALALIEHLIARNFLTTDDAKAILANAQKRAVTFTDGIEGARIIGEIYDRVVRAGG